MRILCLSTLILFAGETLYGADAAWVRATVARVQDGDSFIATTESNVTKVFDLLAVATPSQKLCQPGWSSSQQQLEKLIAGKMIRLRMQTVGDREYAIVNQQRENINLKMIESGYAWFQSDHIAGPEFENTRALLAAAHGQARRQKSGLWSEEIPAVAQWDYLEYLKEESEKRRQLVGNPWSVEPPDTDAIAIVNDMLEFSDKLDRTAALLGQVPPGVLDYAIKISGFKNGLRPSGTLMWWFGSARDQPKGVTYAIPSITGEHLLCNRFEKFVPYMNVTVDGKYYFAVGTDHHALFSQNKQWLEACEQSPGGFDKTLPTLNSFLASQDIALAVRNDISAISFDDLPFSKGSYVIGQSLPSIARNVSRQFPGFTGSSSIAAGMELLPPIGARASIVAAVDEGSLAADWPATMTLSRDRLLADVPDLSPALVLALASCQPWNDAIAKIWEKEADQPIRLRDFRGITLMLHPYVNISEDDPLAFFRIWVHVDAASKSFTQLKHFMRAKPLDEREPPIPFEMKVENLDDREVLVLSSILPPKLELAKEWTFCITTSDDHRLLIQGGGLDQLRKTIKDLGDAPLIQDSESVKSALTWVPVDAQQLVLFDSIQSARLSDSVIQKLFTDFVPPDQEDGEVDSAPLAISGQFTADTITFRAAGHVEALKQLVSSKSSLAQMGAILSMYWRFLQMRTERLE